LIPSSKAYFHYTTEQGLVGIITSSSLWATDALFLNDATEIELAHALLRDRVTRKRKARLSGFQRDSLTALTEAVARAAFYTRTYVSCFSAKFDDLSQWRAYSGAGNGYLIGLDFTRFSMLCRSKGWQFGPCIYDEDAQAEKVDQFIELYLSSLEGYFPYFGPGEINAGLLDHRSNARAREFVSRIAPFYKHKAFRAESEWRVARLDDSRTTQPLFRSTGLGITPYVPLDLPVSSDLISTIMLRSQTQKILAEEGLGRFLESHGLQRGIISLSDLPYRSTMG
jgi:hypothetical protein